MTKRLPLLIFAAILLLGVTLAGCGKPAEPVQLDLPEKWQEFTRTGLLTGNEAIQAFQKEHEKKIVFKQGIRGEYTDGKVKLTIWVGVGANDGHASQMFLDMASRIGTKHKTFSAPKAIDLGFKAYRTEGQDNVNIFYFKGRKVFWIAVIGADDPEGLVKRIYPDFN